MAKLLLAIVVLLRASCSALMVGKRKIQCSTPVGGNDNVDALMEPRVNIPGVVGFVGAQAAVPCLGQCSIENQWQVPWFLGDANNGGGLCPPEFWNLGALVPGLVLISGAIALYANIQSNRLLISAKGLGTIPEAQAVSEATDLVPFNDIDEWYMTPVGLILKLKSSSYSFFPLYWDQKSVEAVLEDRLS